MRTTSVSVATNTFPSPNLPVRAVFTMVATSFQTASVAIVYVIAMVSLFLHLSHGIQSLFQTLGLSNGAMLPRYGLAGKVASFIFLVGFAAIPVAIFAGFVAA